MKSLRICIGKGRGAEQAYEMLAEAGLPVSLSFREGRRLVVPEPHLGVTFVLARQADLPRLLLEGHVDVGIASSVWFLETNDSQLIAAAELPFGRCRLSVLRPVAAGDTSIRKVCTRFPNLARLHLPEAQILRLTGCHEIAVALGFADAVMDVVETGATLEAMDLREERIINEVQHGIWLRADRLEDLGWMVQRLSRLD
jgi:ATP phosphoribosyltransferase